MEARTWLCLLKERVREREKEKREEDNRGRQGNIYRIGKRVHSLFGELHMIQ